jgi:hypothetical protein
MEVKGGDRVNNDEETNRTELVKQILKNCISQPQPSNQKRLERIDGEISSIKGVRRENDLLLVEGTFANYRIKIPTNKVEGSCKGGHKSKHICLETEKGGNIDPAVGLAANLRYDDRIEKRAFLREIGELVLCPLCLIEEASEGVSKEFVEKLQKYSQQKEELAEKLDQRICRRGIYGEYYPRREIEEILLADRELTDDDLKGVSGYLEQIKEELRTSKEIIEDELEEEINNICEDMELIRSRVLLERMFRKARQKGITNQLSGT